MNTASKRRKTFLASYISPAGRSMRNIEVKAYTAEYVKEWYRARDCTNVRVKPKPRAPKGQIVLANGEVRRKWVLDQDALQEACDFLDVKLPVWITRSNARRTLGWQQLVQPWDLPANAPAHIRKASLSHRIMVDDRESPASASRILWHELAHAMQTERALNAVEGDTFAKMRHVRVYLDAEFKIPYNKRPIEKEAESYEQFAAEIAIAK